MNGYKRCKCRDEANREIGASCPRLKRTDGSWSPQHGTWYGKAEFPAGPDGTRVILKQGGFATQDELTRWFDGARLLMGIPESGPDGHGERLLIIGLIRESRKKKAALPDYDETRRRYQTGVTYRPPLTGDYLLHWLERRGAKKTASKNTLRGYEIHIRRVFVPVLGDIRIDKLLPSHIEDCLTTLCPGNPSAATRHRMRATIRKALNDAKNRDKLITDNPAAGEAIQLPSARTVKARIWNKAAEDAWREAHAARVKAAGNPGGRAEFAIWRTKANRPNAVMVWRPAHTGAFLDHAAGDRMYPLFHLIAFRGLRRGEACALKWADADLDDGILAIRGGRVQLGWEVEESETKTEDSDATVSLDTATVAVLRAWRKAQLEEKLAWGPAWNDTGHIFTRADGAPYHPGTVTYRFEWIAFTAGLPPVRLHDLRHVAASTAHKAGADMKTIQKMLRHSSYKLTADTYTSVFEEVDVEVAEKMAGMIPRRAIAGEASETDGLPTVPQGRTARRGLSLAGE